MRVTEPNRNKTMYSREKYRTENKMHNSLYIISSSVALQMLLIQRMGLGEEKKRKSINRPTFNCVLFYQEVILKPSHIL